jgi:hypothetical protein
LADRRGFRVNGQLIRILYEDELTAVRKLLGATFAVGITNPAPSKKLLRENPTLKPTGFLCNNDIARLVTCSGYDGVIDQGILKPIFMTSSVGLEPRSMKHHCFYRGIDFKYHHVTHGILELSVQCRFIKVGASSVLLKELLS